MNTYKDTNLADSVRGFRLPAYGEIPNVGLYLEQVSKYITDIFAPLEVPGLTGSMISNYVKKKLIPNPVKKQYGREQIASLIFITIAKSALSIEQIRGLIDQQSEMLSVEVTYNYIRDEFDKVFKYVFGLDAVEAETDAPGADAFDPENIDTSIPDGPEKSKLIIRASLLIFCYSAYLDKTLALAGIKRSND